MKKNNYDNVLNEQRGVAIYVRESTKRQAEEGYNIEVQEEKCLQYMQLKDITAPYRVYREKGKSAKTTNRKELNQLKQDIRNHKISKLIVYKLDRLVRRLKGLSEIMELCEQYRVDLISVKEEFDSNSLIGRMMINFTIMLAQWEQDIISERTIDALRYAAEQGSYTLGNKAPFGYEREIIYRELTGTKIIRLVPVKEEFDIVKKIYEWSNDGYNNSQISAMVNSLAYMTTNQLKFDDRRIETILSNKIYCGFMVVKKAEFKLDMETVLTLEEWQVVQQNRRVHFKSDEKNEYPFKGLVYDEKGVLCTVDVTNKKTKQGDTVKYYYYESPKSKKRINQNKIIEKIEPHIEELWNETQYENMKNRLEKKLIKCVSLRDKLYKLYISDHITDDIYMEELRNINDDIKHTKALLSVKQKDYDKLSEQEKRLFIKEKIDKIKVNMNTQKVQIILA